MTTVVYYDLECVEPHHVALATRSTHGAAPEVHLRRSDAGWSPGSLIEADTVPSLRSPELRGVLESVLAGLAERARSDALTGRALRHGPVDLLDVAWFDWFFAAQHAVHRAWTLAALAERFAPARLVWVGDNPSPGVTDGLVRAGGRLGFDVRVVTAVDGAVTTPRLRRARQQLRGAVGWCRLLGPRTRAERPGPDRPLVVFTEDFPHLATVLVDAARRLRDDPALAVGFVASNRSVLPVARPLDPVLLEHAVPRAVRLRSQLASATAARAARAAVTAMVDAGIPALGAATPAVEPGLTEATAAAWGKAAHATVLWSSLFRAWRPHVVVNATYTGNSANRAALSAAAAVGGTRVFVQHGSVTDESWKTRLSHDRYLVWGPLARRRLVDAGAPAEAVVATGSAKLDRMHPAQPSGSGPRQVVYLPSRTAGRFVSQTQAGEMLVMVRDAVTRLEGVELTVKVHPDDRSGLFDDLGVTVMRGESGVGAMAGADVVVVSTSTAGFEACALGRPLVVLAPRGVDPPPEYAEFGAALVVGDMAELRDALRTLLTDASAVAQVRDGQRRLVTELFGETDGHGSERIAGEIAELARRH